MKIRNSILSLAFLFAGSALADKAEAQIYCQEFKEVKENPKFENLFDEDVNSISHNFERKIQIYKAVPSKWQRFTCWMFLANDTIVITPEMMPKLYAFVEDLAQKSGMPTPTIFISLKEHVFNAFAAKFLNGKGGILIEQKMLKQLSDKELEATIAHELGHVKYNHTNKILGFSLISTASAYYGLYKLFRLNKQPDANLSVREIFSIFAYGNLMTTLVQGLIIGKRFEKQADRFACEAGHAEGIIDLMNIFEEKVKKVDAELLATNDLLIAEQANLTPSDYAELQQEYAKTHMTYRFGRWIHEKTPFEAHPTNADRIAAAQAYLDAQVPAIEKA